MSFLVYSIVAIALGGLAYLLYRAGLWLDRRGHVAAGAAVSTISCMAGIVSFVFLIGATNSLLVAVALRADATLSLLVNL